MKTGTLFDTSEFIKKQPADKKLFQDANMELLLAFPGMVEAAFVRLTNDHLSSIDINSRCPNLEAVMVNGFLRGALIKQFPAYCGGENTTGRFKLKTLKNEFIYIKKFDDKLRPMNVETNANNKILNQIAESEEEIGSNIFIGYTSDDKITPTGTYAICLDGKNEIWKIVLSDLVIEKPVQVIVTKKETQLKEGIVKVKTKKEGNE